MRNREYTEEYEIYDDGSMTDAANVLHDTSPAQGIILVIGNGMCPVDIPDFSRYRTMVQYKAGKQIKLQKLEQKYFAYLETQRLITSNFLPHRNLLCLLRLVKRGIVKGIITTNYDMYIMSTFLRYGDPYKCVINPLLLGTEMWDCDGYYSAEPSDQEIPLWKIHGDIGFVRMDECSHIFRLPHFTIDRMSRLSSAQPCCRHYTILRRDGTPYADPSLAREHPATSYRHHIDFGADRRAFILESMAAKERLRQHCENGGAVLILGLTFDPRFPEDLASVLSTSSTIAPLVYITASERRLSTEDNELLSRLEEERKEYVLVNEINKDRLIDNALVEILCRLGERDIDMEYSKWQEEGKWWLRVQMK